MDGFCIDFTIAIGVLLISVGAERYIGATPGRAVALQLVIKLLFSSVILARYLSEKSAADMVGTSDLRYLGLGACVVAFAFGQIVLATGANDRAGTSISSFAKKILALGRAMQKVMGMKN